MKQRLVDFSDPILSAVLFILLKDRTTGKNIIWETEPPPELGAGFADEITLEQIKTCPPVPRVLKRLDEQKQRTKARAEVFTPSWVCEKMIDMGEENGAMPDMKKEPIKYIHHLRRSTIPCEPIRHGNRQKDSSTKTERTI